MWTNNSIRFAFDFFCFVDMEPLVAMGTLMTVHQIISALYHKIYKVIHWNKPISNLRSKEFIIQNTLCRSVQVRENRSLANTEAIQFIKNIYFIVRWDF